MIEVWSAPSEEIESQAEFKEVWLRSIDNRELDFHMFVGEDEIVWKPIGSFSSDVALSDDAYASVSQRGSRSDRISLSMVAVGPADQYRLEEMFKNSHLMLLQLPQRQWYVRFAEEPEFRIVPFMEQGREWYRGSFTFVSVAAPDYTQDYLRQDQEFVFQQSFVEQAS